MSATVDIGVQTSCFYGYCSEVAEPWRDESKGEFSIQNSSINNLFSASNVTVNQSISYDGEPEEKPSEEAMEKLKIDTKHSEEWELFLDEMKDEKRSLFLVNCRQRLKDAFSEEEWSSLARGNEEEYQERLLTLLRWRHDLAKDIDDSLEDSQQSDDVPLIAINVETPGIETVHDSTSSTTSLNVPRLRLALKQLEGIDRLPSLSLTMLREAGCLSVAEHRQVAKVTEDLSTVLMHKHEDDLRLVRSLLLQRHPDLHRALLRHYLDVDLTSETPFHHGVPSIQYFYRNRLGHEELIRKWMLSRQCQRTPYLLFIGREGAGKTFLAFKAARLALTLGFHQVFWIKDGNYFDPVREKIERAKEKGDNILLIIDDVKSHDVFELVPENVAVLATTKAIGWFLERPKIRLGSNVQVHSVICYEAETRLANFCCCCCCSPGKLYKLQQCCCGLFLMRVVTGQWVKSDWLKLILIVLIIYFFVGGLMSSAHHHRSTHVTYVQGN